MSFHMKLLPQPVPLLISLLFGLFEISENKAVEGVYHATTKSVLVQLI